MKALPPWRKVLTRLETELESNGQTVGCIGVLFGCFARKIVGPG